MRSPARPRSSARAGADQGLDQDGGQGHAACAAGGCQLGQRERLARCHSGRVTGWSRRKWAPRLSSRASAVARRGGRPAEVAQLAIGADRSEPAGAGAEAGSRDAAERPCRDAVSARAASGRRRRARRRANGRRPLQARTQRRQGRGSGRSGTTRAGCDTAGRCRVGARVLGNPRRRATKASSRLLLASRLAPWAPRRGRLAAAHKPEIEVRPCASVSTPPM